MYVICIGNEGVCASMNIHILYLIYQKIHVINLE